MTDMASVLSHELWANILSLLLPDIADNLNSNQPLSRNQDCARDQAFLLGISLVCRKFATILREDI